MIHLNMNVQMALMSVCWSALLIFLVISLSDCVEAPKPASVKHTQERSPIEHTSSREKNITHVSRNSTFNSEVSLSSSGIDELDNSSESFSELKELSVENPYLNSSIEPANLLEKEYLDYFGERNIGCYLYAQLLHHLSFSLNILFQKVERLVQSVKQFGKVC